MKKQLRPVHFDTTFDEEWTAVEEYDRLKSMREL